MGPHTSQPGQKVLILCQLHLQPSFFCAGSLGEDIQNQAAAVQHLDPQILRQGPHLGGREVVVENDHGSVRIFAVQLYLRALSLADEGPRVRRCTVLQHNPGGFCPRRLYQGR